MKNGSKTQYAVLGALSIQPMSGYEMKKMMNESTNYFWSESEGQIYPALAKCVEDGLATCKETLGNARVKKVYSITAKGRKVLSEWLKKEPQNALVRSEFLLKIFFAGNIENKYAIAHLTKFHNDAQQELEQLEKIKIELGSCVQSLNKHAIFWMLSVDSGIKAAKADLAWSKEAIATLTS